MTPYITYSYENLKKFCCDAFERFGFSEDECKIITDVLLLSDLYGIESHGMQRLVRYHKGIEKGLINPKAKPEVVFETPVSAVIEGNDGMGNPNNNRPSWSSWLYWPNWSNRPCRYWYRSYRSNWSNWTNRPNWPNRSTRHTGHTGNTR